MGIRITHLNVRSHWKDMTSKANRNGTTPHVVRDIIVETARLCETAVQDGKSCGDASRLRFLFLDEKYGLAGWTKEAL